MTVSLFSLRNIDVVTESLRSPGPRRSGRRAVGVVREREDKLTEDGDDDDQKR